MHNGAAGVVAHSCKHVSGLAWLQDFQKKTEMRTNPEGHSFAPSRLQQTVSVGRGPGRRGPTCAQLLPSHGQPRKNITKVTFAGWVNQIHCERRHSLRMQACRISALPGMKTKMLKAISV